jgi:hypothetical protein
MAAREEMTPSMVERFCPVTRLMMFAMLLGPVNVALWPEWTLKSLKL